MSVTVSKFPEIVVLTGNPVLIELESHVLARKSFHKLHLRILDEDDNIIGEDALSPVDLKAEFDVSDYLKIDYDADFNMFDFYLYFFRNANLTKKFKFEYYETWQGIDSENIKTGTTEYITAVQGGFSFIVNEYYKKHDKSFFADIINPDNRFLTWQNDKIIDKQDANILYFLAKESGEVYPSFTVYYSDDTTSVENQTVFSVEQYNVYEFNTSFYANDFESLEIGKTIVKYEVEIKRSSDDEVLVPAHTYYINTDYFNQTREFIFRNSFVCFDSICLRGISETDNKIDRTTGYFSDKKKIVNSQYIEEIEVNSGWFTYIFDKPILYKEYIIELFNSTEVYELKYPYIIDINIVSKNFTVSKDNKYIHSVEIKYELSGINKFYSNAADASGMTVEPGGNVIPDGIAFMKIDTDFIVKKP